MSSSLNKVTLIGNLGEEPEIRTFQNGGKVANFSIATSESWKDRESGERKEKTQWHRVSVQVEGLVTICEKYLRKGSKVYIEGQLETRKYTDKDGKDCYLTEVVMRPYKSSLIMLNGKSSSDNDSSGGYEESYSSNKGSSGKTNNSFEDVDTSNIDDEIPF